MAQTTTTPDAFAALSDAMADAAERAGRSVVAIHARRRIPSTGIHWRAGVIVTAAHTLERSEGIHVTLPDGTDVSATLAGRDAGTDLAALRLDGAPSFDVSQPAEDSALRAGKLVLALGRPWKGPPTVSLGLISSVGGEWRTWQGGRIESMVRLDMAIHDGFSGGPLVEASGRVLGINTSALARGAPVTIPAVTVERVTAELLSRGRMRRGFLGLAMHSVRLPESARAFAGGDARTGLMVVGVEAGGPGDRAGIVLGDVLLALGESSLRDLRDVAAALGPDTIGTAIEAHVLRAGSSTRIPITIGERTEEDV
jgi:S1-C subfamily serine protease